VCTPPFRVDGEAVRATLGAPGVFCMSLRLIDLGFDLAERSLFDHVHLTIAPRERVAIVGDNGAGKTTLLRVAAGMLPPARGRIHREGSVGLLEQLDLAAARPGATVLEQVLAERSEPRRGAFDAAVRAAGLDPSAPAEALSGGERQRARLAALLAAPADTLCLDEPTNHLDAEGIAWLVDQLHASPAALLVVDHDRAFLDAIAERTAFLAHGGLRLYAGGYHVAAAALAADDQAQRRRHDAQSARHQKLRAAADRQRSLSRSAGTFDHRRADGQATMLVKNRAAAVSRTHARASAAMRARLERETPEAKPFDDRRTLRFRAADAAPGPSEVLVARGLGVERGGRTLVAGLDLALRRGERLALDGPNGSGKTTLLEVLTGRRPASAGTVRPGVGLTLTYVAQADRAPGPADTTGAGTVGDALRAEREQLTDSEAWEVMASVGAPCGPDRAVATLSGGERQRLELARVALTSAHYLVLDEPTLHLDVRAIEALQGLLLDFPGTVLLVSHDAALVASVATRRLRLAGDGGWGMA
jgi:ATPase subunit of ABC transporter with duplicated ATPase domains